MSPPAPPPRGLRRPWLRRLAAGAGVTTLAAGLWGGWAYRAYVVEDPGPAFTREGVMAIIAQESPVTYRDGKTPLGAFFDQEHRRYVPYAELPRDWIDAIVAAEDGSFWDHPGVDPKHILRAVLDNLRAGELVAGGSTLTQQTAKNLFYRPDRSLRSKSEELVNALRLEAHFSKEDILEFYANQFHVSANGRGLGIAARYFFDKTPDQLGTKECAYIAGMVKGPANYNPFLGQTEERRAAARAKAEQRTAYVLRRMLETGKLDERRYQELLAEPLVFTRGAFQYDRSVVLDEVQRELESPRFVELFERLDIENPSTAGIRIITTLDPDAQRESTWALWHHLSEVGATLEKLGPEALILPETSVVTVAPGVPLVRHQVYVATVAAPEEAGAAAGDTPPGAPIAAAGPGGGAAPPGAPAKAAPALPATPTLTPIPLDLGGRACTLGPAELGRLGEIVARARSGNPQAKATAEDLAAVRGVLRPGAKVLASVRGFGDKAQSEPTAGPARCDLELRPELQGAVVVLEDGQVRAMVGGNDNRNFNRATTARRQFGSTWKPLVYEAALQLGWLPTDVLDNRRAVFPLRDNFYYPQPDHAAEAWYPMSLVGARSENLASVWLLYHLTDRLNPEQLRQLAGLVGLSRAPDEAPEAWLRRLRDEQGLRSSPERFEEYAFTLAREDVLSGMAFTRHPEDALAVRSLLHGRGFAAEQARLLESAATPERATRLAALGGNLLSLEELARRCEGGELALLSRHPETGAWACGQAPEGYLPLTAAEVLRAEALPMEPPPLPGAPPSPPSPPPRPPPLPSLVPPPLPGTFTATIPAEQLPDLLVDNRLHLSTLRELRAATDRREAELAGRDPWDPEVLALSPDFRVLVGIAYLQEVVEAFGVRAELPTTLSLPLGAAELRLVDVALLYQGLLRGERSSVDAQGYASGAVTGLRTPFELPRTDEPISLIAEIRDAAGNVLYRATPKAEVVADPLVGEMVGDILHNVVTMGTGRRAARAVVLGGQALPLAGKTGTTNDYRNAAFVGIAPRGAAGAATWGQGFTVAAYVGYDDNRSMRRGGYRVQGASGALPVWVGAVRGLADAGLLGEGGFDAWTPSAELTRIEVPAGAEGTLAVLAPANGNDGRRFAPVGPRELATASPVAAVPALVAPVAPPAVAAPEASPSDVSSGAPHAPAAPVDPTAAPAGGSVGAGGVEE